MKGSQSFEVQAGGKKVQLRFEAGWIGQKDPTGSITLTNPEVGSPVKITVNSTLDSDAPSVALFKASSQSLNDFLKVSKRDEMPPSPNLAGANESSVWRLGNTATGQITSCEAYGVLGEFYWLATFHKGGALTPAERKAVDSLLASMSIEPAP